MLAELAEIESVYSQELHGQETLYEAYQRQDTILAAAGWHPTGEWWLGQLKRLSAHPTAYCLCGCCGRRAGKSTFGGRVGAVELLDRKWHVPEGDPNHVFAFFSVKLGEALARLDSVEAICKLRGVQYWRGKDEYGHVIKLLDGRKLEWRAIAANFRTAVGQTYIGFWCDELARWIDRETSANPASFILASARPAMLTHLEEGAHEYLFSSPLGKEGAHFEAIELGDTEDQVVARATSGSTSVSSWEANPTTSEAQCERLCRREQLQGLDSDMDRDYRANPTPLGVMGRLDPSLIIWLEQAPEPKAGDMVLSGSDLGMRVNASAQAITYLRGETYLVRHLDEMLPDGAPLKPSVVCAWHRRNVDHYGANSTMTDGHYRESLREAFIEKHENEETARLKILDAPDSTTAVIRLRTLMQDGAIRVYAGKAMRARLEAQLLGTQIVNTPKGQSVRMQTAADGNHCDLVAALANATFQTFGARIAADHAAPRDKEYEALVAKHKRLGLDKRTERERAAKYRR